MKLTRRSQFPLLAILLAGTALRAFRLGAGSLWYDETVSVFLAGSPLTELIRHTAGDIHPPGYYVLLRGWLLLAGYPTGHADAHGQGLEFMAGFFSLFFGVLLIALACALACRLAGKAAGLIAAALVAFSPYNIWYSQEVRMYTLGAVLAALAVYAIWQATMPGRSVAGSLRWWTAYALAAAGGLYTLYYCAFLLVTLNLWALARLLLPQTAQRVAAGESPAGKRWAGAAGIIPRGPDRSVARWQGLVPWLLANLAAAALFVPWIPIAWRQATQPPVPPWRAATALGPVLRESWTALVAGQSAPAWLWPAVLLLVPIYLLGLFALARQDSGLSQTGTDRVLRGWLAAALASPAALLTLATFGALAVVLLVSAVTPLYHVRYLFTYSPAFYVVLAAGLAWLWPRWRPAALAIAALWLTAAAFSLHAFWYDPAFRPDDHRAAVAYLESHWRPGDAVLVNAGYAYPALATYWQGPIDWRGRLTGDLPHPAADNGLVLVNTGHIDGAPGLGWDDPRSDFFPLPAATARGQIETLFGRFSRVWHYRIYDTVNDPQGTIRGLLAGMGQLSEERTFPGEAFLRVQSFASRSATAPDAAWPAAGASGLDLRAAPLPGQAESGQTIYPALWWWPRQPVTGTLATSLRLIDAHGTIWAQPPDEKPLGPEFTSSQWPAGHWQRQAAALPIPTGTPPGHYQVELVPYDAASGQTWPLKFSPGGLAASPNGISLGQVTVVRPQPEPALQPAEASFGSLALLQATSPADAVSPGDRVPVELLWQAQRAPEGALVVVLQLLDGNGKVVAGREAQPLDGRYPTQAWEAGEIVRDRHSLELPKDLGAGTYRLIVGLYQATDGQRLRTSGGPFARSDSFPIKTMTIRP